MDNDPSMRLSFGDHEFEATPDNTALFRFVGRLAMYNHVFIVTNEETSLGTYIFRVHPGYSQMEQYMLETDYPVHDNLRGVAQCDLDAYDKMIAQSTADLDDGIPEGW